VKEIDRRFDSFNDFYPYYLTEHKHRTSRRLHFTGTFLVILIFIAALVTGYYVLFFILPLVGYSFAWIGHFFFEKNKPATFRYPLYSLLGDFRMFRDMLTGRIKF
jgi:hypothetical protein